MAHLILIHVTKQDMKQKPFHSLLSTSEERPPDRSETNAHAGGAIDPTKQYMKETLKR